MADLTTLLEEEQEKMIHQLEAAETPDKAQAVVEKELDRLLYRYNENCADERERTAAQQMLQAAKVTASLVDCIGDVEVWDRAEVDEKRASAKKTAKNSIIFMVLLVAGIALAEAGFAVTLVGAPSISKLINAPLVICLLAGGMLCLYLAGRIRGLGGKNAVKAKQMTRCRIDAAKIYRMLHGLMIVLDRNLKEVRTSSLAEQAKNNAASAESISAAELAVFAGLIEAEYSRDSEYAFEKLKEIRYYLHTRNIEVVDYSPEHPTWFDRMPSMAAGTIRPALVANGKLLKKGVASAGL